MLCCAGPLVPILLGFGSASALFGLDRYKPWFIGLGLVLLALAAWTAVRRQNRCCAVKSTARSVRPVALVFGVGIGAYLLLQFAAVPALASLASERVRASQDRETDNEAAIETATIQVEGMTCAGCAVGVESAFFDLPGVADARVNWQTETVPADAWRFFRDCPRFAGEQRALPTLVMHGTRDNITPIGDGQELGSLDPHTNYQEWDANHDLPTDWQPFETRLMQFLHQHFPPPS